VRVRDDGSWRMISRRDRSYPAGVGPATRRRRDVRVRLQRFEPLGSPPSPRPGQARQRLIIGLSLLVAISGCRPKHRELQGEIFDAGPISAGSIPELNHRFLVTNSTGRTVQILGETHSCNCTTVAVAKKELKPGESMPLDLNVKVPSAYAKVDVSSTLKTDDPDEPAWTYRVRFEAVPRARISPDRIELEPFTIGGRGVADKPSDQRSPEVWLELYTLPGEADVPEPGVIVAPEGCAVRLGPKGRLERLAGGLRRVRRRLYVERSEGGTPSPGTFTRPLSIPIAGGWVASAFVTWTIRAPMAFTPSQIHFGMIAPGEISDARSVILRAVDGRSFRILSVDAGPLIQVNSPRPDAVVVHDMRISLRIPSGEPSRSLAGWIRVKTDRADFPEVQLLLL